MGGGGEVRANPSDSATVFVQLEQRQQKMLMFGERIFYLLRQV